MPKLIKGSEIHKLVSDYFINKGFETKKIGNKVLGFTHGAGHGVGLEIHEKPVLNAYSNDILEEGNIVTIEPGLYYPKVGGVRIEDMVLVTKNGCKNLTNFPKFLEI
ncbi:MAG: M24 family metallopeptidase [Minisyncoccia bacterium]